MSVDERISFLPDDDYAQSANTLFHFMTKAQYLKDILSRRAIVPRYCVENIEYLHIHREGRLFGEAAILQKCFCDIPFHKLGDRFEVHGIGKEFDLLTPEERGKLEKSNTHFTYYGEYAVAFSKSWGEQNKLQPIHYLNESSQYAKDFSALLEHVVSDDSIPDEYAQDIINRLAYIKPIRGIMNRKVFHRGSNSEDVESLDVQFFKNFRDECEWRYVPSKEDLASLGTESIIANPKLIRVSKEISKQLEDRRYQPLWLKFSYDDIRYIIVPDTNARVEVIKTIMAIPDDHFENQENIPMQKSILISKILVLAEIRKDW